MGPSFFCNAASMAWALLRCGSNASAMAAGSIDTRVLPLSTPGTASPRAIIFCFDASLRVNGPSQAKKNNLVFERQRALRQRIVIHGGNAVFHAVAASHGDAAAQCQRQGDHLACEPNFHLAVPVLAAAACASIQWK